MQIKPFDPHELSERQLTEYHLMMSAVKDADFPEDPPLSYDAAVGRLRNPPLTDGECLHWAAYQAQRLVGWARLRLPTEENAGVVKLEVVVHPELRRQGIGTAMLRAVLPTILDTRRGVVIGSGLKGDGAGAAWVSHLGFTVTASTVMQRLAVKSVPPGLWGVPTPSGYRLTNWIGTTPDDLIDSYAAARPAIRDAPLGQATYVETAWTVALVRETERELSERGVEERVFVAIDTATGQVAGVTGILNYPHRREFGYQDDTSVLAAHRGHGLGRAMKAAMMRWIVVERPDIEYIYTTTAAENSHMINVNLAIGYETIRGMVWTEIKTTDLASMLGGQ